VAADANASSGVGIDMGLVRAAATDSWMRRCERFLAAYPSFSVKTGFDEWRRARCVRSVTDWKT
jgi:hypothetical protein